MSSLTPNESGSQRSGGCGSDDRPASLPARRQYWRSLDDLQDTEEFRSWMHREFPSNADLLEGEDRRQFMKLMGASFALAGLGAAACRRIPEQYIVPYSARPAERIPGKPMHYATSVELGGIGLGVIVRSYDARPIKIEGNPDHPTSVGGCEAIPQSEILRVYDQNRSRTVLRDGVLSSAQAFETWIGDGTTGKLASGRVAVLAEVSGSPSVARMRQAFLEAHPTATWHEWKPAGSDGEHLGTEIAFGSPHRAQPMLENAEIIVCLDADPLHTHPAATRLSQDWATRRRLDAENPAEQTLSRMYSVEGVLSLTGMNADDRLVVRPGDVGALTAKLAKALGVDVPGIDELAATIDDPSLAFGELDTEVFAAMVKDLQENRGKSVLLAGETQPPAVHALVAAMNVALENVGKTVAYTADPKPDGQSSLRALVERKDVDTVIVLGGNPIYDAPADFDFPTWYASVPNRVHLAYEVNETSRVSNWHLPRTHFLESWGDTAAHEGTLSITQPLIEPMLPLDQRGWSSLELLAFLAGYKTTNGYDIVRETESTRVGLTGVAFEKHWRTILDLGVIAGTSWEFKTPRAFDPARVGGSLRALAAERDGKRSREITYRNDGKMYDGRFASVAWLQELPDPITKITWDNAALMNPELFKELELRQGDLIEVTVDGRTLKVAAFPVPGMDVSTIAISLGWGRGEAAGPIGDGAGFDAYRIRSSDKPWIAPVSDVRTTGETYLLAQTQDHGAVDALDPAVPQHGIQERLPALVRETVLDDYRSHPDFAKHRAHVAHRLSLWEETNLDGAKFRWAMSIDLNTCTGCGACITACQAENNIPVVGKDQIARGREMYWLRVDRYFKGNDPVRPDAVFSQPVTCMQCENAPCEQVCPVAATVHDKDGLNVMVYNRCIGTRYCSNNCPYKVRRFNWFDYWRREPVREQEGLFAVKPDYYTTDGPDDWRRMQLNPEVTVRNRGVMEKCNFCTQRIQEAKIKYKNEWAQKGGTKYSPDWSIPDDAIHCACAAACPTQAIKFGDLNDPKSEVSKVFAKPTTYQLLEELNTKTRVRYVARVNNPAIPRGVIGGGHGHGGHGDHGHDGGHDENHGHDGHAAAVNGDADGVRA